MTNPPVFLTESMLMEIMGVSRQMLFDMRTATPPQIAFVKFGPRVIRYPLSGLPEAVQAEFLRAWANEGIYAGISEKKAA